MWFREKAWTDRDFYVVHKEEFSITCYMCNTYIWQWRSLFIRDKPILSSEKKLHKVYDRIGSLAKKKSGREPQGAWRQDELIGGKPQILKWP
jgi:hypothetical protein